MRSQVPATVIAVIITLCVCAIAFLAYLMWDTKVSGADAASVTTVVSTTVQTVTEPASTVTVTRTPSTSASSTTEDEAPTTSRENSGGGSYAADGEPCTSAESDDRVHVGRRVLVCTYQGPDSVYQYMWEYE